MKNLTIIKILIGLCVLVIPQSALAARVSFSPSEQLSKQDKPYATTVVLHTEGENINAIEGTIKLDSRLGTNIQLSDSGSIVTYWIAKPVLNGEQNVIQFSGAIPGGYTGNAGILFSIILPAHSGEPIERAISVSDFKALRNDGVGSSARVTSGSFSLGDIAGQIDEGIADQLYLNGNRKDDIAPEVFSPQISQDPNIFNNRWFISFATTDKQSGIDHYEIQETKSGSLDSGNWKTATSPYELQDQELHSFVYVIAIDRQGNERIIKVFPRRPLSWTQQYGSQVVAILLLVTAAGAMYYRRRKYNALQK